MVTNFPPMILLAGGRSERMGTPKGLVMINGTSLFEHQIQKFSQFGGSKIIVVLGHIQTEYQETLEELKSNFPNLDFQIVINPHPTRGQFSSLQEAIVKSYRPGDGYFILPIDTPLPDVNIFTKIIDNQSEDIDVIIPTSEGVGGHPIWISDEIAQDIMVAHDDQRLDLLIKELSPKRVIRFETGIAKIILNLNTMSDVHSYK